MVLTLSLLALMTAEPVSPELLQKLAAHNDRIEKLDEDHVLTVVSDANEKDGDGKVTHTSHTVTHTVKKDGKNVTTVETSSRDGEDRTEKAQKKFGDQDNEDRAPSPFLTKSQPKYDFTNLGTNEKGQLKVGFAPKTETSSQLFIGEALVDPEAGELLSMDMKPSKNPTFVDRMRLVMEFDTHVDGVRALSKLTIDGAGGVLMFKKQGGAVLRFSYAKP